MTTTTNPPVTALDNEATKYRFSKAEGGRSYAPRYSIERSEDGGKLKHIGYVHQSSQSTWNSTAEWRADGPDGSVGSGKTRLDAAKSLAFRLLPVEVAEAYWVADRAKQEARRIADEQRKADAERRVWVRSLPHEIQVVKDDVVAASFRTDDIGNEMATRLAGHVVERLRQVL